MILDHVAQRARSIIVTGSFFDTEFFGDEDVDAFDPVAIPQRFEDGIGEAENQQILNGGFE